MPKTNRSEKRAAKKEKQLRNEVIQFHPAQTTHDIANSAPKAPKIEPQTENQAWYMQSIYTNTITFGIGYAGTGKTYIATAIACDYLKDKSYRNIIITRPAVETGKSLGALPGDLDEKMEPYIAPVYDILTERLGKGQTEALMNSKVIKCEPLNYMRGKTYDNSVVILDEAQNATPSEIYMMLTRMGKNSKLIINGDLRQQDIKGNSGLAEAISKLQGMKDCDIVEFEIEDIVRSGIVKDIIIRYMD